MKDEFLAEFKALLTKYNADISFAPDSGSDTHGFTGSMIIELRQKGSWKGDEIYNSEGSWEITQYDI